MCVIKTQRKEEIPLGALGALSCDFMLRESWRSKTLSISDLE